MCPPKSCMARPVPLMLVQTRIPPLMTLFVSPRIRRADPARRHQFCPLCSSPLKFFPTKKRNVLPANGASSKRPATTSPVQSQNPSTQQPDHEAPVLQPSAQPTKSLKRPRPSKIPRPLPRVVPSRDAHHRWVSMIPVPTARTRPPITSHTSTPGVDVPVVKTPTPHTLPQETLTPPESSSNVLVSTIDCDRFRLVKDSHPYFAFKNDHDKFWVDLDIGLKRGLEGAGITSLGVTRHVGADTCHEFYVQQVAPGVTDFVPNDKILFVGEKRMKDVPWSFAHKVFEGMTGCVELLVSSKHHGESVRFSYIADTSTRLPSLLWYMDKNGMWDYFE